MSVESIITENLDIWTSAIKTKSTSGRGSFSKLELYGIKKLRDLILTLGVQGKLTCDGEIEDSASELLNEITNIREALVENEGLKTKASNKINDSEIYFDVPKPWSVCRLGNLAKFIDYRGKTPNKIEKGVRLITAKNVRFGYLSLEPAEYISEGEYTAWMTRGFPQKGDLLFTPEAPLGNVAVIDLTEKFALAQRAICLQFHKTEITPFLKYFMMSSAFQSKLIAESSGITATGIKASKLKEIIVPLPSLSEQRTIVHKIEELMALCDQLESQTEASIEAHQTLIKSLLETLTNAKDADELNESWQRISEHFDVLFTTVDSIDQLKQTILQLAVMGKLVKQAPNDEPASKLLGRIAIEKEKLIKDKKIKKQKSLPIISHTEMRYELPSGWVLTRFSDFVNEVATGPFGSMIHKSDYIDGGIPLINPSHMVNGFIKHDSAISVTELKAKALASYKLREGDLVMARRGEMGRSALVTTKEDGWLCGTGSFVLNFNYEVSRKFLLILFKTDYVKSYLGGNSVGSTMTNLNHGILNKMPIMVPPVNEQREIAQKVECLFTICENLRTKIVNSKHTETQLADSIVTVQ